jgi:hypothetical protein
MTQNSKPDLYPDQWITHDSPENQEREHEVIQRYCEATHAGGYDHKGIGARYDAEIFTPDLGELREIVEIKNRSAKRSEVDFYNIDMKKVDWLTKKSIELGVPGYLVVRWSDDELTRLNLSNANTREWRVKLHKHPTRKEFPDLQYLIPVQEFERI